MRAIAVLLVVVFHVGLPVPGGFVGVDVFFVISGFVITSMLQREWFTTGHINFKRFYWRRFKRLTPALALVVVITMVLTAVLLSPSGPQQAAALTGLGSIGLIANFVIAWQTSDYFASAAETNPLLNTWSLSVEEQFYLFFPAVLVLGWYLAHQRKWPRWSPLAIVAVLGAFSFSSMSSGPLQSVLARVSDLIFGDFEILIGFFSPIPRVWEFAAGALLALVLMRHSIRSPRVASGVGILGLMMLTASAFLISDATPFPSAWTLLPVIGTVLLITAGTHHETSTSRLLGARPLVKIGDWSYSIYLWHWPFIVFAVRLWPTNSWAPIAAAIVAMLPAVASYHWLEQPVRVAKFQSAKATFGVVSAVVVPPLVISAAVMVVADRFWMPRIESGQVRTFVDGSIAGVRTLDDLTESYLPCLNARLQSMSNESSETSSCVQSKSYNAVDVALIGDSHASQLFDGFAAAFPMANVATYALASTPPVADDDRMRLILDEVASDASISTVVINAHWTDYKDQVSVAELVTTLRILTDAGKKVFVLNDIPTFPFHAMDCLYGLSPILPVSRCSDDAQRIEASTSQSQSMLEAAVDQIASATLLDSAQYLCTDERCDMTKGGQLLYRDSNHLNELGSQYVTYRLIEDYPELRSFLSRE